MEQSFFPNINELAKRFGTPLYLYDFSHITRQYSALKDEFAARKSLIAYALKANSNLSIVAHLARLGAGADCVSLGEVKRALLAGIAPYKIIFSGVGKQEYEIREALKVGILFLNVESEAELLCVEKVAHELGICARISLRVNPDIDPKTHPYISTGLSENKFGVSIDEAKRLYLYAHKSEHLEPVAIHFHIGSQILSLDPLAQSIEKIAALLRSLLAIGLPLRFFDVGGGIGIAYKNEQTFALYDYAQRILANLSGLDVTIICEPGRFLVGNSGFFVCSVLYEKTTQSKRFVIVDGAMNDLVRPTLYQAYHDVAVWRGGGWLALGGGSMSDIVGPICESGDWLAKDVVLPPLQDDDLIVFKGAGAYGMAMASNYNSRPRAAEAAFMHTGEVWQIRKRESMENLWELELPFLGKQSERD
ncbi:MAG: diaminopimelate decarboxylase [Helicobacter sp.]|nr:diaminopimelate decarboxylase [Helicobacter sp.]